RAPARAGLREVPGLKLDLCRRRAGTQFEISLFGIHEHRVGDEALPVVADRLPFVEALVAEGYGLPGSVPVEVEIERTHVAPAVPDSIRSHGKSLAETEEVASAGQFESADAAAIDFRGAIEREDVVLGRDVSAVVHEQTAVLAVIDEVLLDDEIVAA